VTLIQENVPIRHALTAIRVMMVINARTMMVASMAFVPQEHLLRVALQLSASKPEYVMQTQVNVSLPTNQMVLAARMATVAPQMTHARQAPAPLVLQLYVRLQINVM